MNARVCIKCGTTLSDGDLFCPKCGNEIELSEELSQVQIEISSEKRKKKSKKAAIIICIAALAVIGIAVFLHLNSKPRLKSIQLEQDRITINPGTSLQLTFTVLPEDVTDYSLEWDSTNESVVHVTADGYITALKQGGAIITVSSDNGVSAVCRVTVKQSAFDYLKGLNDYIIDTEPYAIDGLNSETTYGIEYNEDGDYPNTVSLYQIRVMDLSDTGSAIYISEIIIPPICSGNYQGEMIQYMEYYVFKMKNATSANALYSINAETLSDTTKLRSYNCSDYERKSSIDETYTIAVGEILDRVSQKVLIPEGYSLSDLGFLSW